MPLFEYQNPLGERREFILREAQPTLQWGHETWTLVPIQGFSIGGRPEPSMGDQIIKGYQAEECRQGSRFKTRLPARRIKEAWADERTT